MSRRCASLFVACGLLILCAGSRAGALSLVLTTATPDVLPGASVEVDVVVSGLIAGRAPSLGSFDLDVDFDAAVLGFQEATFSLLLGDPALGEAIASSGVAAGVVDLFELSLLSPAELDGLQPTVFTIATITFSAAAAGTSTLEFTQDSLGNAFGQGLPVDEIGSLTIRVPEPRSLALFLLGIPSLAAALRRQA